MLYRSIWRRFYPLAPKPKLCGWKSQITNELNGKTTDNPLHNDMHNDILIAKLITLIMRSPIIIIQSYRSASVCIVYTQIKGTRYYLTLLWLIIAIHMPIVVVAEEKRPLNSACASTTNRTENSNSHSTHRDKKCTIGEREDRKSHPILYIKWGGW